MVGKGKEKAEEEIKKFFEERRTKNAIEEFRRSLDTQHEEVIKSSLMGTA